MLLLHEDGIWEDDCCVHTQQILASGFEECVSEDVHGVMQSSERDPVEVDVKRRVQNVAICTKLYTFHG